MRKSVIISTFLLAALAAGMALWLIGKRAKAPLESASSETTQNLPSAEMAIIPEPTPNPNIARSVPAPEVKPPEIAPAPSRTIKSPTANASAAPARPEPSPYTRQLLASLQLDPAQGPITPERAAQWKLTLQQLVQQGAGAVPAISEFLEKNLDFSFASMSGGDLLGKSSMRMALLEALQAIGGPEALMASAQTLQTTSDPREIAWLARSLEQQAPEQYRQLAVTAANEALAMAAAGKLPGRDVGPLFEVLQQYGGPAAAAELAKATEHWNYYAAITLANLPEGAGVPTLVQIVEDPNAGVKGTRAAALQMLAQVSAFYPEAREALFEQARANKIPPSSWPAIASVLGGEMFQMGKPGSTAVPPGATDIKTYHLTHGNQDYFSAPNAAGWSPAQIQDQLAFIQRLLNLKPDPFAMQVLQTSYASLSAFLNKP